MWGKSNFAAVTAAAIVLLGAGGAGAYVIRKQVVEDERCAEVVAAYAGRDTRVGAGKTRVAIIGDSYSAGDSIPDWRDGWAYQMPKHLDWTAQVAGVGSTGFVADGACGNQSFDERIASVLASKPDLLVIQGGINDANDSPTDLRYAASLLVGQAVNRVPVVVVGPVDAPSFEGEGDVDRILAEVAADAGARYVSAIRWDLEFLPDRLHLTEAGHAEYARLVAEALEP